MTTDFSQFRVLIDDPASRPELGFRDYAGALSDIVRGSTPEFAVGIFGSWGTGKTTLMREIERSLQGDDSVVTAWFTAWRYEREPHLIVPLVDVLRESLDQRAETEPPGSSAGAASSKLRRAGRAFLAGLTLSARVPGVELKLDPAKVMAELQDESAPAPSSGPLSFYHAAFRMLREAIEDFSDGGDRRVVIFVDDLDRCLPANALDVLESMKLFFDVQGCVFVVGLDQAVAERAVAHKYASSDENPRSEQSPVSGVDYLKKIFQVPFALPRIGTSQLREYCSALMSSSGLVDEQVQDFRRNVEQHLEFLPDQDSVNPREIKRLINAYILQVKMLSRRMGPAVNPAIVLALQIMSFRPDWRDIYDDLAADPSLFQRTVREALEDDRLQGQLWLANRRFALPGQLAAYLRGPASDLLVEYQLASYVSAAESTRSTDPLLLDAQATVNRLRVALAAPSEGTSSDGISNLVMEISRLSETLRHRSDQPRLAEAIRGLESSAKQLTSASGPDIDRQALDSLGAQVGAVEDELRELRRQSNLGAYY